MNFKKSTSILVALCLLFNLTLFAQKDVVKFGKVSDAEVNMTVYEKDTSASAVLLLDYGMLDINYLSTIGDFILDFTVHRKIKILTKDGLDYANQSVSLYDSKSGDDEVLLDFKAQTYNMENGKQVISKITKKEIFTEQKSENYIAKKFALTNVKVGSVIEYEYTIRSPYFWSIEPWYFQAEIPIVVSDLRLKEPEYFSFKKVSGGYIMPSLNETNSERGVFPGGGGDGYNISTYRWVYKDVPAFKNEEYITTPKDYQAKIDFELQSVQVPGIAYKSFLSSWKQIGADLMEDDNFGGALNRHGMVKELTDQINPNDSVEKKIETAYLLIKKMMKWDESYGIYISNTLKSVSTKKQGSMAEINLLLVNLLRSVGVEAYPVLISTRSHGKINQFYPRISSFNTVLALAKVKGKNILMDATIAYLRPGQLTYNTINGEGLMVDKNLIAWVPLLSTEQYITSSLASIEIKEGQIKAKLTRSTKSLEALNKRQKIASEGKDKYIENYKKNNSEWEISEYLIENDNNPSEALIEKINISNFTNIDAESDIIYIPSVLIDKIEKNPFSSETREYPVDFAVPINEKYILSIAIPEGYQVDELPKAVSIKMPDNGASFVYQVQQVQNNIQVVSQLKITRTLYLPDEYQLLKELFTNIISKYGEQIVLKKKI
ncbi:MAG: DUF3857 domain-containing protein [Bacteroidales bacterium]